MTNSGEGEGLLFYGNIIIPFKDRFDKNLKLYAYMTTKPEEVQKRKEEEEKAEAKAAQEEEAIRAFKRRTEAWQIEDLEAEPFFEDADFEEVTPSASKPEAAKGSVKAEAERISSETALLRTRPTETVPTKMVPSSAVPSKVTQPMAVPSKPVSGISEARPAEPVTAQPEQNPESIRTRRPRKPFVWTPGELEDEEYWLDADLPEESLDEENPDRRYILPDDDDET